MYLAALFRCAGVLSGVESLCARMLAHTLIVCATACAPGSGFGVQPQTSMRRRFPRPCAWTSGATRAHPRAVCGSR